MKQRMEKITFNSIISGLATFLTYLLGGWDSVFIILALFMALDYITGFIYAYVQNAWSSQVGFKGIAKKSLIFVVLIVAVLLDRLLNDNIWVFRTLVCYFYIANEGISLLENTTNLGLPVPEKIKSALAQLQKDKEERKS